MVQFSPTVPADLIDAFKTLETNKFSTQGTIDLFKQALQHIDEITFVDKEKFIAGVKEKAKDNPELKKLAIKILLEAGNKERSEIDKKLDALPDSENFLEKYEAFQGLFGHHSAVNSSIYLELCSSPVEFNYIKLTYDQLHPKNRTPEAALHINKALQHIKGDHNFYIFSGIMADLSLHDRTKFIQCVSQLDPEEVKALCLQPITALDVLDWGEDAFKNFYHNAKIAISGMTDPVEKARLINAQYWWIQSSTSPATREAVFSKDIGDSLQNIGEHVIRSNIIGALLNVSNDERDDNLKQSLLLAQESGYGFINLSSIITALNNVHKERREKVEEHYLPLMQLITPDHLPEAINIFNEYPPEKLPELIDLARAAKQEGLEVNYNFLKGLVSIPPEITKETFLLLKKCSNSSREISQLMNTVSQLKNKEEIPQILKHIITLKDFATSHCPYPLDIPGLAETLLLIPSKNRESAIASLIKFELGSVEGPLLILGSFSASSQEKLEGLKHGMSPQELITRDSVLKEEFIQNLREIIQNTNEESMPVIIQFLDDAELWMPSFAESILRKDMTCLEQVIKKGSDEEILNYLKSDEGLRALAKVAESLNGEAVDEFMLAHFTEEEVKAIQTSGIPKDTQAVETIASPDVLAYLKEVGFFIRPNIKLTSMPERHEPLSEESRKELQNILGSRQEYNKRNWKEIQYTPEMINAIRPTFDELMKQLLTHKAYRFDKTITVEGKTITIYQEELDALDFYTSQNYLLINGVLDNDETSLSMWCEDKFKKKLDELSPTEKLQLKNAIQALDPLLDLLASVINKFPIETHPIYRGDALPESELARWKVGRVFATSKIFSCSIHPSVCEDFAKNSAISYMKDKEEKYKPIIYVIDSKSSRDISTFSVNEDEDERSYLPNQCFQVQGIDETTQPGLAIIYLSEVDPQEKG